MIFFPEGGGVGAGVGVDMGVGVGAGVGMGVGASVGVGAMEDMTFLNGLKSSAVTINNMTTVSSNMISAVISLGILFKRLFLVVKTLSELLVCLLNCRFKIRTPIVN
jgi:hypothetical protein